MEKVLTIIRKVLVMLFVLYIAFFGNYALYAFGVIKPTLDPNTNPNLRQNINQVAMNNEVDYDSAQFDGNEVRQGDESAYADAQTRLDETISQYGIGFVAIPNYDIHLPILAGMSDDNLFTGVGTYSPDRELGKDNFVAMSHSMRGGRDKLLNRLDEVVADTPIYATDYENVYEFRVTYNKDIHETEVEHIANDYDEGPILTLFRCIGGWGTEWRQMLHADLVDTKPIEQADEEVLIELGLEDYANARAKAEAEAETAEVEQPSIQATAGEDSNIFKQLSNSAYLFTGENMEIILKAGVGVVILLAIVTIGLFFV